MEFQECIWNIQQNKVTSTTRLPACSSLWINRTASSRPIGTLHPLYNHIWYEHSLFAWWGAGRLHVWSRGEGALGTGPAFELYKVKYLTFCEHSVIKTHFQVQLIVFGNSCCMLKHWKVYLNLLISSCRSQHTLDESILRRYFPQRFNCWAWFTCINLVVVPTLWIVSFFEGM